MATDAVIRETSGAAEAARLSWAEEAPDDPDVPADVALEAAASVEMMRITITDTTQSLPKRLRTVAALATELAPHFAAISDARIDLNDADRKAFDTLVGFFVGQTDSLSTADL